MMLILESNVARQFASLDSIQTGTEYRRRSGGNSPHKSTKPEVRSLNTRLSQKPFDKKGT